jgi:hypothetical protein
MYTNLYLVEKLDRQHRQQFLDAAAQDRRGAQLLHTRQHIVQHVIQAIKASVRFGMSRSGACVLGSPAPEAERLAGAE